MMQNKLVFINGKFSKEESHFTDDVKVDNTRIIVEKNAQVCLFEKFTDNNAIHVQMELHLAESSSVIHEKIQDLPLNSSYNSDFKIFQHAKSNYQAVFISTGSSKATDSILVTFEGENASCEIHGLCKAVSNQHLSTNISVNHKVPNCRSMQNFRGVVSEKAIADFDSMAYVREGAKKSEAHQYFKNLLLDKSATVNANPQLEIYTDDVICSHGATVGQLDGHALFYLISRGIEKEFAKNMLMDAFTNEITNKLSHQKLKVSPLC